MSTDRDQGVAVGGAVGRALRESGRAVVVATTSAETALALLPDRVHVLRDGRVVASGDSRRSER